MNTCQTDTILQNPFSYHQDSINAFFVATIILTEITFNITLTYSEKPLIHILQNTKKNIVGDFIRQVTQKSIKVFRDSDELKNLLKEVRYYKNPKSPLCISLILKNNPNSFQNSEVMMITIMKTTFEKLKPNIVHYRGYRFRENLFSQLSTENIRVDCDGKQKGFYKYVLDLWMNLQIWMNFFSPPPS